MPVASREALKSLDASLQTYDGPDFNISMTLRSNMPIILDGKVHEGLAVDQDAGAGRYVFTGSARLQTGNSFIGVIDPALPKWVKSRIDDDLSFIFAELDKRWEAPLQTKRLILGCGFNRSSQHIGRTARPVFHIRGLSLIHI